MTIQYPPDRSAVLEALNYFLSDGSVREIRVLNVDGKSNRTDAGYFNDADLAADAVMDYSGDRRAGVYITANPVNPALLARSFNRFTQYAKNLTKDADILKRTLLYLDFDPLRPNGICATNEERALAGECAKRVHKFLTGQGWPEPRVAGWSGNGARLFYGIDLPNDDETKKLIIDVLTAIEALFEDKQVSIDTGVFNAARIVRLAGTWNAKGDSTPDRPYRLAVDRYQDDAPIVQRRQLEQFVSAYKPEDHEPKRGPETIRADGPKRSWKVSELLELNGIEYVEKELGSGTFYELQGVCLTSDDHKDRAAGIIEYHNGKLNYTCRHDRCQGKTWHDAKQALKFPEHAGSTGSRSANDDQTSGAPDPDDWQPTVVERRKWPKLRTDALHGLAGDVVRAIDPHTEADPVATLVTFLGMFGSSAGRSSHVWIGEDRHGMNENFAIVGDTSNGRKGSSMSGVLRIMGSADEDWYKNRRKTGLASGEGFIWQIRDAIYKKNKNGEDELIDEGVSDKRLFVYEEEMSKVLAQTERKDNTVSGYLRVAWDSRDTIEKLTISNPCKATNPHVSVLGHITETELLRRLNETEIANGFANRFLWVCVKRSKPIPEPTRMPSDVVRDLGMRTMHALAHARRSTDLAFTDEARSMWISVYAPLTDGRKGLYGALTARGAAHVRRLALIYAVLDLADSVDEPHLRAALALWQYADDSARYLFGDSTGNSIADRILEELRTGREMTATDVRDLFSRNQSGRTDAALRELIEAGLIGQRKSTGGNGRPATVFFAAAHYDKNDRNDKTIEDEPGTDNSGYDRNDRNDKSQHDPPDDSANDPWSGFFDDSPKPDQSDEKPEQDDVPDGPFGWKPCIEPGCIKPIAPGNNYYCLDHDPRREKGEAA